MLNTLEKIHRAALKFLVPLTPDETYATIVHEAVKLVNGQDGSILLYENNELNRVYATSKNLYQVGSSRRILGNKDPRYEVVKKRVPMVLTAEEMTNLQKKFPHLKGMENRAAVMIPLSYKDETLGMLSVVALEDAAFSQKELNILRLYGSLASLAIRKTQLYNETKHALEVRDLFISMAAHELRTPLTTLSGYVQLLYAKLGEGDSAESRWVRELNKESIRLRNLINELLEINRIKTGQFEYIFRECKLKEIIDESIASFKMSHPDRKIIFNNQLNDTLGIVIGDPNKLLQVIDNIISNAVKYSKSHTPVVLELQSKNGGIILKITDQGRGISKKDLPKIFEGYYKGENSTEESLGVGLFLAKSIIDKHNGEIKVKSKINQGTTVEIRLPQGKRHATGNP